MARLLGGVLRAALQREHDLVRVRVSTTVRVRVRVRVRIRVRVRVSTTVGGGDRYWSRRRRGRLQCTE